MDGDLAPLAEMLSLTREYDAALFVDDAHGMGVMGQNGRGTVEHWGLEPASVFQMGTLSKALGTSGGYAVGSEVFIQNLINSSRSFMYTTAPPPAISAAAEAAIGIVESDPDRRFRLWHNRNYLYRGLIALGFKLTNSQSAILPIILNDPELALEMSSKLLALGTYVPAIRPPTVPKGTSRLRLTITSDHTTEQMDSALLSLKTVGQELRLI